MSRGTSSSTFKVWARGEPDTELRLGWWDNELGSFSDFVNDAATELQGNQRGGDVVVCWRIDAENRIGLRLTATDLDIIKKVLAVIDESP